MFAFSSCKRFLLLPIRTDYLSVYESLGFKFLSVVSESNKFLQSDSTQALDFLVNSCGLSPEKAVSIAQKIRPRFKTKNPYSVLNFLETSGFSKTQITKLISMCPRLLFAKVEGTIKPRIKLFRDIGLSDSQVAELISSKPNILITSLNCHIVPSLESIRSFVGTNENVIKVIKRSNFIITSRYRFQSCISVLKEYNVPDSRIAHVMIHQPGSLMVKAEVLKEIVENIQKLGFKPDSGMFVVAMNAMCSVSKSNWDSKVSLLKEWGWSEEQILHAFKRVPHFMRCSETKMKEGLDFFAKALKWDASVLSKYPKLLLFSLRSRVIPRLKVFKILKSKKLLEREKGLISLLDMSEKEFFEKFVVKYQDELPDFLKTHDGLHRLGCSDSYSVHFVESEVPEEVSKDTDS